MENVFRKIRSLIANEEFDQLANENKKDTGSEQKLCQIGQRLKKESSSELFTKA